VDVVVSTQPGEAIVYLTGELDLATVPLADAAIFIEEVTGKPIVTLDISKVTFCDSSGLRLFLRVRKAVMDSGGAFAVVGASGAVARSIEVTGLTEVLTGEIG
jgi:anti-anti-sigma factor